MRAPMSCFWRKHLNIVVPLVVFIINLWIAWLVHDQAPPYVLSNGHVASALHTDNGMINFQWDVKYTGKSCPFSLTTELKDTEGRSRFDAPKPDLMFVHNADDPATGILSILLDKPLRLQPGIGYYRLTFFYRCPIFPKWTGLSDLFDRTLVVETKSIPFEIE